MTNRAILLAAFFVGFTIFHAPSSARAGKTYTQAPTRADSVDREGTATKGEQPKSPEGTQRFELLEGGPQPQWIWGDKTGGGPYWLRKEFEFLGGAAQVVATCDNRMTLFLNGKTVLAHSSWETPIRQDVSKLLVKGKNVLLVQARNDGGQAGLALKLAMKPENGKTKFVVSDKSWKAAKNRKANNLSPVVSLGAMGVAPWGDVFSRSKAALAAAPRNVFHTPPGFQVELLFTVPKGELGSWVCIAFDEKGRLIASDQGDRGLCRITPPPIGGKGPTKVERLDVKMTSAQGMLQAFGSLYCSVNGGPGSGFYRLRDSDGDGKYEQVEKLKALQGGGEHGPHAIRLAPDGKSLLVIAGNHTNPPANFNHSLIPSNWSEDLLLARQWDARGHARGKLAPGGWIAHTDPDGQTWTIRSIGYRNSYDMDFNADGELFAYDADMEWDMGSPWYRPTRLCHAVSGSEFGWRSGTGKWPVHYPDSLPPTVDIGPGSPVGATFGYGTKFPAKYQKALYLLDWTFGTIYAVHLTPEGASYRGVKEEFLSRTPLPLTDAAVGPDGALYFAVGGRGTQSELYRVTYTGKESTAPVDARNKQGAELRKLRRELEALHAGANSNPRTVDFIWRHLGHQDRFIRYAARIALEHRPLSAWVDRLGKEKEPHALITAAIALARKADKSQQARGLSALHGIEFAPLNETQKLELLRAYGLLFIRLGKPDQATAASIVKRLDGAYPAKSNALNRELSRLLVYLQSPTVITKSLELMKKKYVRSRDEISELLARNPRYGGEIAKMLANQPEREKVHLALVLRNLRYGWTLEQRKEYFAHLAVARTKSGGASYQGFIDNIRKEALANSSEAERKALEATGFLRPPKVEELPKPKGPGRDWTVEELVALAQSGLVRRSFQGGRRAYAAAQCVRCHRFGGEGGATGPDLTNSAGRFSIRDLAEALVEPSKVISDQYKASIITTLGGKTYNGRILSRQDGKLTVLIDPVDMSKTVTIPQGEIDELLPSKVSLMPKDSLDTLNREEALDLLAYLLSRGNPQDKMFEK